MAGPRTRRNTGGALTDSSGTFVPTPTVSRAFTSALVQTPILTKVFAPIQAPFSTLAPASALSLPRRYINKDLQRAIKLALELFVKGQEYGQLQANSTPCKQLLKAWFPDLYYKNSHLNCY